jgi:hypothetical protein
MQIAAGGSHSLALKYDGTVVAWGYNNNGQSSVPAGLSGVTQIAGGGAHSLALKSDGTVVAWGYNGYGTSTVTLGLSGVMQIAGGSTHTLAIVAAPALNPTSIVSRKTHGADGTFDISLPLTGTPGIECRTGGSTNDYQLVLTFPNSVSISGTPQAQITSGTGDIGIGGISNGGAVTISGNIVTVPLTNVANAQTINVTLYHVNGAGNVVVPMSVLVGDTNANGAVNAADIVQTKERSGQSIDPNNFRSDVNLSGAINAADLAIVKSRVGTGLP